MMLILHRSDQKLNGRARVCFVLFLLFEYATVKALKSSLASVSTDL